MARNPQSSPGILGKMAMFLHVYREHINPSIRCGTEQPGLGMLPYPGRWRWVEKDQPGQKGMVKQRELSTLGLEISLRLLAST